MTTTILYREELDALTPDERRAYVADLLRDGYVIRQSEWAQPSLSRPYYVYPWGVYHAATGRLISGNGWSGKYVSQEAAQGWVDSMLTGEDPR